MDGPLLMIAEGGSLGLARLPGDQGFRSRLSGKLSPITPILGDRRKVSHVVVILSRTAISATVTPTQGERRGATTAKKSVVICRDVLHGDLDVPVTPTGESGEVQRQPKKCGDLS